MPRNPSKPKELEGNPASGADNEVPELFPEHVAEPEKKKSVSGEKRGRKPKYSTEEERRAAKAERDRERRQRMNPGQARPIPNQSDSAQSSSDFARDLSPTALSGVFKTLFGLIAKVRKYPAWNLTQPEAEQLSATAIPVLDKHGGAIFAEYGEEAAFGLALVGVTGPRIIADINHGTEGRGKNNAAEQAVEPQSNGTPVAQA
jgi:hypothetical protein